MSWYSTLPGVREIERDGYLLLDGRNMPEEYNHSYGHWNTWAAKIHGTNLSTGPPRLSTVELGPAAPSHQREPIVHETDGERRHICSVDFDLFDPTIDAVFGASGLWASRHISSIIFQKTPQGWYVQTLSVRLPLPRWLDIGPPLEGPNIDVKSETDFMGLFVANQNPPCDLVAWLGGRRCTHLLYREDPEKPADLHLTPRSAYAFLRRLRDNFDWFDESGPGELDDELNIPEKNRARMKDEYLELHEGAG